MKTITNQTNQLEVYEQIAASLWTVQHTADPTPNTYKLINETAERLSMGELVELEIIMLQGRDLYYRQRMPKRPLEDTKYWTAYYEVYEGMSKRAKAEYILSKKAKYINRGLSARKYSP